MGSFYRKTAFATSFDVSYVVILLFILFLFTACSGGEGGTGVTSPSSSDVSKGQITGFGSIFVNGVEFDTNSVAISMEGISGGSETDLKLGMVVTVKGKINADGLTGTADSVAVEKVLRGFVQTNNLVDTLTVLDQTIEIPGNTRFDDGVDITGLALNAFVEVSGYLKGNGVISATRIELLGAGETESKLFGSISNLDTTAQTFNIGNTLLVSYSSADISGFSNNTLSDNAVVKVKGSYDNMTNTLTAESIENALVSDVDVGEMEIEGFVTSIISASNFMIGSTSVVVDADTTYEGGGADEIFIGMFIEVEGALVNGTLMAKEIEFDDEIRIEAEIASVSIGANTLSLTGMAGLSIKVDAFTGFGGVANLAGLSISDTIRIRAFQENMNTVVARRIDTTMSGMNISLQGFVTVAPTPNTLFDIMSIVVDTTMLNSSADFFKEGEAITRTKFFEELEIEDVVEAKGTLTGGVITWTRVEIID